jgi:hypothetical protein
MKREIVRVEPISTYLERWKAPTSVVTRTADTVYVSGLPPFDPSTGEVIDAPLERQTELVLEQMKLCLKAAGTSSCADRPVDGLATDHGASGQVEPRAARLGELLLSGDRQSCLPRARQLHRCAVAPVVAQQVQGQATQGRDLSTLPPLRVLRACATDCTWARPGVDEGVRSCPRAGCGRSACPVR